MDDAVHEVGIEMIGGAGGIHDLIQTGRGDKFRRSRFLRPGCRRPGFRGLRFRRPKRDDDRGMLIRGHRHWQRQRKIFFVAGDLVGGHVGEAGVVCSEIKTSRSSHHQAMLVANAEAVAENRQLRGSRGTSEQSYGDGKQERGSFRRNSRSPLRREWSTSNHLVRLITG